VVYIPLGEQVGDAYAFGWCAGMYLVRNPDILDVEILFQVVDNTLADIAERSNEIGKNTNGYGHAASCTLLCWDGVRKEFYTGLAAFSKDLPIHAKCVLVLVCLKNWLRRPVGNLTEIYDMLI